MEEMTQSGLEQAIRYTAMADKIMLARFKEKYYKLALDALEGIQTEDSGEQEEVLQMKESVFRKLNGARAGRVIEKYSFALKSREYARLAEDLGSAAQHFEEAAAEMEKVPVDLELLEDAQKEQYLEVRNAKAAAEACRKKGSAKFQMGRLRFCGMGLLLALLAFGFLYGRTTAPFQTLLGKAGMAVGLNQEAADCFEKAYSLDPEEDIYAFYLEASAKAGTRLYNKGELEEACTYLHTPGLKGNEEAAELVAQAEEMLLKEAEISDTVVFGGLKWLVLDKTDTACFLARFDAVLAKAYQENAKAGQDWADSSLRTYLNEEYLTENFNACEIAQIQVTQVEGEDNPVYGTDGGQDTEDRLYLLSCSEYEEYKEVINPSGHCCWLRTPGAEEGSAAFVNVDQTVMYYGYLTDSDTIYVKPVMWVSLSE